MATVDNLQIQIEANAVRANDAIDKLVGKLDRLSTSLGKINGSSLTGLANGVQRLGNAMQTMNTIKTADFTRLARNLQNIGNINVSALNSAASSMSHLTRAFNGLGTVSQNAIEIGNLAKNISKLGNKGIQNAITNIPQLATALKGLMQTLSTAPTVSRSVIQMTNALANLASSGSRVGSASNSLISGLTRTGSSMSKTTKKTLSLASAFGKFYASYWVVVRALKGLWSSIESSMDYVEVLNYFNAAFGQVADSAVSQWEDAGYESAEAYYNSFSERAQELTTKMTGFNITESGMLKSDTGKSLGIDPSQLMQYQAMFAQMSNSMGITAETSLKLSTALTEIGADLASVKNMDFDKVWTDMASGLAGMSRTLDKYGVNIRNVNLQQKLSELGIDANITALNQNDKALLRTIILLDSTRYAWGDLADTINQPANQLRMLKSNFSNLARTIGNIFLPIVAKVLPYVNALVVALQKLAEFIVNLLGFEDFDWGGSSGIGGVDLGDIVDDTEDLAGGLDDAASAAKELKGQLQGIDELNVLSTSDTSGSGGSGGSGGISSGLLDSALDKILEEYQKAWDKAFDDMEKRYDSFANHVAEAFKSGGLEGVGEYFSKSLASAMDKIDWNSIYLTASNFGIGLSDFLNGLISPSLFGAVGRTIAGSLNTALYFLNAFGTNFDWTDFGNSIATGINNFFDKFEFGLAAQAINRWLQGVLKAASTLLKDTDFELIGKQIGKFLTEIDLSEALSGIASVIWQAIKDAFSLLKGLFEEAPIETSLIAAFSVLGFTGLGKALTLQISVALSNFLIKNGITLPSASSILLSGIGLVIAGEGIAISFTGENDLKTSITSTIMSGIGTLMLTKNVKLALLVTTAIASFEIGNNLYEKVPTVQQMADSLAEWIFKDGDAIAVARTISITLAALAISLSAALITKIPKLIAGAMATAFPSGVSFPSVSSILLKGVGLVITGEGIKTSLTGEDDLKTSISATVMSGLGTLLLTKNVKLSLLVAIGIGSFEIGNHLYKKVPEVQEAADALAELIGGAFTGEYRLSDFVHGGMYFTIDIITALGNLLLPDGKEIDANKIYDNYLPRYIWDYLFGDDTEKQNAINYFMNFKLKFDGFLDTVAENIYKLLTGKISIVEFLANITSYQWGDSEDSKKPTTTDMTANFNKSTWGKGVKPTTTDMTANFNKSTWGRKIMPKKVDMEAYFNKRGWKKSVLDDVKLRAWFATRKIGISTEIDCTANIKKITMKDGSTFSATLNGLAGHPAYATGGFPEDGWFRASRGEIMGKFDNGQSVVANNMQITQGISDAVHRGNQENNALVRQEIQLLGQQNELLMGILEKETGISYKDVFKAAQKGASEYTARTGNPAFI